MSQSKILNTWKGNILKRLRTNVSYFIAVFLLMTGYGCSKVEDQTLTVVAAGEKPPASAEKNNEKKPEKPVFKKFTMDSVTGDKVTLNFTEISVAEVFSKVENLLNIEKGEFESSEEFKGKVNGIISSAYYENVEFSDFLPFTIPIDKYGKIKYSYDPDKKILDIKASSEVVPSDFIPAGKVKPIKDLPKKVDFITLPGGSSKKVDFVGENAFGAKRDVSVTSTEIYGLISNSIPFLKYDRDNRFIHQLNDSLLYSVKVQDSGEAISLTNDISSLLVFKLKEPYIARNSFSTGVSMNNTTGYNTEYKFLFGDVIRLVIYRKSTGEIIASLPKSNAK